jgi:hypothetical protein
MGAKMSPLIGRRILRQCSFFRHLVDYCNNHILQPCHQPLPIYLTCHLSYEWARGPW